MLAATKFTPHPTSAHPPSPSSALSAPATQPLLDRMDKRWLGGIIACTLLFISLPYVWALLITPEGMVYGGLLFTPDDQNVHLAWARQAAEGHLFFRDLFTTESLVSGEKPLFHNIFCWLMGRLSSLTHIPLIWVYHGFRLLASALTLYTFYLLCAILTTDKRIRLIALLFAAFTTGAGWLQDLFPGLLSVPVFIDRPDQTFPLMPEAFTFSSALVFPLFIVAMALLCTIYYCVLQAQETGQKHYVLGAGAAALVLANIHTYDAIPLNTVMLLWIGHGLLLKRTRSSAHQELGPEESGKVEATEQPPSPFSALRYMWWLAPLVVIICASISVGWQWIVFRNSYEFKMKALTFTPPPPLFDVLLSYGPLMALAALGIFVTRRSPKALLMTLWAEVTLFVIYIPPTILSFSRKMIEGLHLPLCFLAAIGLVWLVSRLSHQTMRHALVAAVIGVACVSPLQMVKWCLIKVGENNFSPAAYTTPLYLPASDLAALHYLAQHHQTQPDSNGQKPDTARRAVLCLPYIGSYLPRETGLHVYVGHWAETLNFGSKFVTAGSFFSGQMSSAQALDLIKSNKIRYVLEGTYEKALGQSENARSWAPRLPLLKPIYKKNGTIIYEVPSAGL